MMGRQKGGKMKRDLVSFSDWSREEIWEVLELAAHLKREQRAGVRHDYILRVPSSNS
jgi:ornithine carbamoyltransferase (EC 2.1.3.3)